MNTSLMIVATNTPDHSSLALAVFQVVGMLLALVGGVSLPIFESLCERLGLRSFGWTIALYAVFAFGGAALASFAVTKLI